MPTAWWKRSLPSLSRIRWLFVIARNSSFTYKGRAVDVKRVGRELGVRYVLEGSVRKGGKRVRITAQLIETESGTHIWAERYDRALDDIFALQDEITLSTIGAIEPSLRAAEIDRINRKRPDNLNAYDLLLRALPNFTVAMPEEARLAIPLLEHAVALEPHYALAHGYFPCVMRSFSYATESIQHMVRRPCAMPMPCLHTDETTPLPSAWLGSRSRS